METRPYGSEPAAPRVLITLATIGTPPSTGIILFIKDPAGRKVPPFDELLYGTGIHAAISSFAYFQLNAQQQQEWAAIPGRRPFPLSVSDWGNWYLNWTAHGQNSSNGYEALNLALRSGDPGQILSGLFMAAVFTNWVTNQTFLYASTTAPPDKSGVTLTADRWAFGPYQFFLKDNQVVAYQVGAASRITLAAPIALPSLILGRIHSSEFFQRIGIAGLIEIRESLYPNGRLTPEEKEGLRAMLNAVPAEHLQGLRLVDVVPNNLEWQASPRISVASGNTITLYMNSPGERAKAPWPMSVHLAVGIGARLYERLTADQKNEFLAASEKPPSDLESQKQAFGEAYANWIDNVMLRIPSHGTVRRRAYLDRSRQHETA